MSTLASTAMPIVSTKPAMPGSVSVVPITVISAMIRKPWTNRPMTAKTPNVP